MTDFNDALRISWIGRIYIGEEGWRVFPKVYGVDTVLIYGAKYVEKMLKKNRNWFLERFFACSTKVISEMFIGMNG